jgi:hypothetical protein
MPQVSLPITTFVEPNGQPLANGTLLIRLSQDGNANSTNLCANICSIALDAQGNVTGNPLVWPNADITPSGTYYILAAYSAQGELVSGPDSLTV